MNTSYSRLIPVAFLLLFLSIPCIALPSSPVSATVEATQLSGQSLLLHITDIDLTMNEKDQTTELGLANEPRIYEKGMPDLPRLARIVRIPDRGNATVRMKSSRYRDIANITLPLYEGELSAISMKSFTQSKDGWYPANPILLSEPGVIRDARTSVLSFVPVQYNAQSKTLRVYDDVELEIITDTGVGINEISSNRHHPVPSFAPIYAGMVGAEDLFREADAAPPGKILVIGHNNSIITSLMNIWITWKRQRGAIIDTAWLGTTVTTETIHQTILDSYLAPGAPLESVILVGDDGASAIFNLPGNYNVYSASDHPYMCLVGVDSLPDVSISRFSAESQSQLLTMISRSIKYELAPDVSDTTRYNRALCTISNTQGSFGYTLNGARFTTEMLHLRGIDSTSYQYYPFNETSITSAINNGILFWAHHGYWIGQLNGQTYGGVATNRPFVAFLTEGSIGNWGGGSTGLPETLIRLGTPTLPRGAIAAIGTSMSQERLELYTTLHAGFFRALGEYNAQTVDPMFLSAKIEVWRQFSNIAPLSYLYWAMDYTNMMSDGTARFWTGVPHPIELACPDSLPVSCNWMNVQVTQSGVPICNAIVTAWKRNSAGTDETYDRGFTDANGMVSFQLRNQTSGAMIVTAAGTRTGQNYIPAIDTIRIFSDPSLSLLTFDSVMIADSLGVPLSAVNCGETAWLSIRLHNTGDAGIDPTLTDITGIFLDLDSRITSPVESVEWDSIPAGQSAIQSSRIPIDIVRYLEGSNPTLKMVVLYNETHHDTITFQLPVHSIHLTNVQVAVFPVADPHASEVRVSYINTGLEHLERTPGYLFRRLPDQTWSPIDTSSFFFPSNELVHNNSMEPLIDVPPYPGMTLEYKVIVEDETIVDSIFFSVQLGSRAQYHATGPDAYGYFAIENVDSCERLTPVYQWEEIMPARGGTGTRLGLSDVGDNYDTSTVVALPFSVRYYGLVYDSITICSNGWAALGNQYQCYSNPMPRPIPALDGPRNLLAVNWSDMVYSMPDNTQGVFVRADSARFVVTWRGYDNYNSTVPVINEFQLILRANPYPTINSTFLFQYKNFNIDIWSGFEIFLGRSIGIGDPTRSCGLEIMSDTTFTLGSTHIPQTVPPAISGRAILFECGIVPPYYEPTPVETTEPTLPNSFELAVYPNPFNSTIQIRFSLPTAGLTEVFVTDILGRTIYEKSLGSLAPGSYTAHWNGLLANGEYASSGTYFLKVQVGDLIATRKIALIK